MKLSLPALSKEKLQQIILAGIITVAVSSAVYIFYVARELNAIQACRTQIASLQTKICSAEAQARQDRELNALRPQIMGFIREQEPMLVTGDPFSWAVRQVSLLSEKHAVHVVGIRPGMQSPHPLNGQYATFGVSLDVDGSYDDLGRFVRDLENRFSTLEIRKLDLQGGDPSSEQRRLTLDVAFLMLPANAPQMDGKGI